MAQTFKRKEIKYFLCEEQYNVLLAELKDYVDADVYGEQTVCNIYFDTPSYSIINESMEKPPFKEKLRIRSYGVPQDDSMVYLELKKKFKGIVYKRRIMDKYVNIMTYLNDINKLNSSQTGKEINYYLKKWQPEKKVFLAYNRKAFVGKENKELRITFDSKIRYRQENLCLDKGEWGEPLYNFNYYVMEIKVEYAYPIWLCNILTKNRIFPNSFSKYSKIYQEKIMKKGCGQKCLTA